MNNKTRKLLTEEVLGECWHENVQWIDGPRDYKVFQCPNCKRREEPFMKTLNNHTFTTRNDMMDLYEAIQKMGKWGSFIEWMVTTNKIGDFRDTITLSGLYREYFLYPAGIRWLFCLDGEGYEVRCQMVADWREGEKG